MTKVSSKNILFLILNHVIFTCWRISQLLYHCIAHCVDLYIGIVTTATGVPLLCVANGFVARFVEHGVWYHNHSLNGEQYLRRDGEDPVIRDPETRAPRTGHLSTGYMVL